MTKVSTKIIEEYKKVGDNHYTVKTDQGEQKYKKEDVRE